MTEYGLPLCKAILWEKIMKLDSNITAIVTGGASGLGEATVRLLAEKGVKCGIFDLNEEKGEAVAKDVGGALPRSM